MNPPLPPPPTFSAAALQFVDVMSGAVPPHNADPSAGNFFSAQWTLSELQDALKHIKRNNMHSALGKDKVAYSTILSIDETLLLNVFQRCIDLCEIPTSWADAVVAAVPKKAKPLDDPDSYRVIGLQSCFLKVLTLLIDRRLRRWADSLHFIPDSQNGFRPKYRTNNNSFILRCAVDKAKSEREPLFVAFIDLSNAFPSTNHSALWWKLHSNGARGPIIDWLKHLYKTITYEVRLNGQYSDVFKSLVGILAGDPASPQLWNIYLADFAAPEHACDVVLGGRRVSSLAQADDIALFCKSHAGLQLKINALYAWCAVNFLVMNFIKSVFMMFADLPATPALFVGSQKLVCVSKYVYVGVAFQSSSKNIFAAHYAAKALKAKQIASTTLGLEAHVGIVPPKEGKKLYIACIDPHLIFGAELILDTSDTLLDGLAAVQRKYLRRILGLNPRSVLAPLFTETDLLPLKCRRAIIALRYLKYLISLPDNHYAKAALLEVRALAIKGSPSWFGDLYLVLSRLCPSLELSIRSLPSVGSAPEDIDAIIKSVITHCEESLQQDIQGFVKTELLWGRMERNEKGTLTHKTMAFRHYLYVPIPEHRLSFTRLLLSDHCLASEQLRRVARNGIYVPRERRLCRFCKAEVEDPVHALLVCTANTDVVTLRAEFLDAVKSCRPPHLPPAESPRALFHALYHERKIVNAFARYAHRVLKVFDAFPILRPPAPDAADPAPSME